MFSEELKELDRNTVQLMIDEMQEEIDRQRAQIKEQNRMIRRSYERMGSIKGVADLWELSEEEVRKILETDEE